jgi:hypothetical protein
MTHPPFLTDAEITEICAPLVVPAYQVKYLKRLGLIVNRRPNGKPLVARGEFERVLVGRAPEPAQNQGTGRPNRAALLAVIQGGKRGAQAQGR